MAMMCRSHSDKLICFMNFNAVAEVGMFLLITEGITTSIVILSLRLRLAWGQYA